MSHGAKCGLGVKRVAELVAIHDRHGLFDEAIKQALVHVNPLDPATALARVEHRAVDKRIHCAIKIGVIHDIAWIFTAKL